MAETKRNTLDLLTPTQSPQGLLFGGNALTPRMCLEFMTISLDNPRSSVSDQVLGLAAKQLLRLEIYDVDLAYALGGAIARIARTKDSFEGEMGDDALAHLQVQMNQATAPSHRAWFACLLGDAGLQYASGWGGVHLEHATSRKGRRAYCQAMAAAGYQAAVDVASDYPSRVEPWVRQIIPPLRNNTDTATAVLTGLRNEHVSEAHFTGDSDLVQIFRRGTLLFTD